MQQDRNREQNLLQKFATDLFAFWDKDNDGFLIGEKLARFAIAIGLAPSVEHFYTLLVITTRKPLVSIMKLKVTVDDFLKLINYSRVVNRVLKVLNDATKALVRARKPKMQARLTSLLLGKHMLSNK